MQRFLDDAKRFPPAAYEAPSRAWKGETHRQFIPQDRAQMHMLPTSAYSGAGIGEKSEARRTQVQNSLIGNGMHVPSVMLALFVLLQLFPALMH